MELEQIALRLFTTQGFEETTVEDIATAAGVGRRTFFRYFPSKNDVVWGDFDTLLAGMESWLASVGDDLPTEVAIRDAVVRFNSLPADAVAAHRERMAMILHVPALQAHSTLRYADWRRVVADFVGRRLGEPAESLRPQLAGHLSLAAAVTAYEQWLADETADLPGLLTSTFDLTGWSGMVAPSSNTRG